MKEITQSEWEALTGAGTGSPDLHESVKFLTSDSGEMAAVLVRDKVDGDFGFACMTRVAKDKWLQWEQRTSMPREEAEKALVEVLALSEDGRKPPKMLGSSIVKSGDKYCAIIHWITPAVKWHLENLKQIPPDAIVEILPPKRREGQAKSAGSAWLADFAKRHPGSGQLN